MRLILLIFCPYQRMVILALYSTTGLSLLPCVADAFLLLLLLIFLIIELSTARTKLVRWHLLAVHIHSWSLLRSSASHFIRSVIKVAI